MLLDLLGKDDKKNGYYINTESAVMTDNSSTCFQIRWLTETETGSHHWRGEATAAPGDQRFALLGDFRVTRVLVQLNVRER